MEVASELKEYHYESCIDITTNTRMITAICLDKLFVAHYTDKEKTEFVDKIHAIFQ